MLANLDYCTALLRAEDVIMLMLSHYRVDQKSLPLYLKLLKKYQYEDLLMYLNKTEIKDASFKRVDQRVKFEMGKLEDID